MRSPEYYRLQAAECAYKANQAILPDMKDSWQEMAELWMLLAGSAERRSEREGH